MREFAETEPPESMPDVIEACMKIHGFSSGPDEEHKACKHFMPPDTQPMEDKYAEEYYADMEQLPPEGQKNE